MKAQLYESYMQLKCPWKNNSMIFFGKIVFTYKLAEKGRNKRKKRERK
jgi:hypothetical protein